MNSKSTLTKKSFQEIKMRKKIVLKVKSAKYSITRQCPKGSMFPLRRIFTSDSRHLVPDVLQQN